MLFHLMGKYREGGARLFLKVHSDRRKANGQVGMWEVTIRYKESHFPCKDGQTVEGVAHTGCGSSIPGDTQNLAEQVPSNLF